jgi:hypothetical protein
MVVMCDVSRATDQLATLRRKVGQAGKETIVHLGRTHDDLANVVAGLIYRLTPREQVALESLSGIGVFSEPRIHIGDASFESETWAAWKRAQGYTRAPDGGLGRRTSMRGSLVW